MTTEELLKPRYRVIARWPKCQWSLGSVLIHIGNGNYDCEEEPTINGLRNPEDFSANLQILPWWKDRKAEEMPEYVKSIKQEYGHGVMVGDVIKVREWVLLSETMYVIQSPNREYHPSCFVPATKEEYEAYIKGKDGSHD